MVEIGGKPILWHIMQIHTAHGITEFCGLPLVIKGDDQGVFLNFFAINNDLSVDLSLVLQLFMTEISPSGSCISLIPARRL